MACADVAVALLAAGRSTRFGTDKLAHLTAGTMLAVRAARTIAGLDFGHRFAVVGGSRPAVAAAIAAEGFVIVRNDDPAAGVSHSIRLAVAAASKTDAAALMICLADMPFVTTTHLDSLVAEWRASGGVVASSNGGTATPPALFPRAMWPILEGLEGDRGARDLITSARLIAASAYELRDIDRPADLSGTTYPCEALTEPESSRR